MFFLSEEIIANNCATFIYNSFILLKIVKTPGFHENTNQPSNDLDFCWFYKRNHDVNVKKGKVRVFYDRNSLNS